MPRILRRRAVPSFKDLCVNKIVECYIENKELAGSWLTKAAEHDEWLARRCFLMIYSQQTEEEQTIGKTFVRNHKGFSTFDAVKAEHVLPAVNKSDVRLTSVELDIVRELVTSYRIQVLAMLEDSTSGRPNPPLNKKRVRHLVYGDEDDSRDTHVSTDDVMSFDRQNEIESVPPASKTVLVDSRVFSNVINVALRGALAIAQPLTAECVFQLARGLNASYFQDLADFDLHFRLFDIQTGGTLVENRARPGDTVYVLWENERTWHRARVVAWMPNGEKTATVVYHVDNARGQITGDDVYWVYRL